MMIQQPTTRENKTRERDNAVLQSSSEEEMR
jgi:hypothetical protein